MGLGLVREGRKTKKGLMAWKKIEKLGTRSFPQVKRENEDMRVTRDGGYSQQVKYLDTDHFTILVKSRTELCMYHD